MTINSIYTIRILVGLLLFGWTHSRAQQLTLSAAIQKALQQNQAILIANNQVEIANNSATAGNAGLMPTVALQGGLTYSNNNTRQEFANNFGEQTINGAESLGDNLSVQASYTLFDGLGSVYKFRRLKENAAMSEIAARAQIEAQIIQLVNAYYQVAELQEQQAIIQQTFQISKERMQRAKLRFEIGNSSKSDYYAAKVDYNNDSLTVFNSGIQLQNATRLLNKLMGDSIQNSVQIDTTILMNEALDFEAIKNKSLENNAALLNAEYTLKLAELDLKTAQSANMPVLRATASYGISENRSEAGILMYNRNLGLSAGLNLQYNLYTGGSRKTAIQNAQLQAQNNLLQKENAEQQLQVDLLNAYANYQYALQLKQVQITNLETAELNFNRVQELFKLGQVTNTQFREAQLNLLRAKLSISNAKYTAKKAELEIMRLSGELLNS